MFVVMAVATARAHGKALEGTLVCGGNSGGGSGGENNVSGDGGKKTITLLVRMACQCFGGL